MRIRLRPLYMIFVLLLQATFVTAFAAAKKSRKNTSVSPHKGFGKGPPSLEEILAAFKTREPSLPHNDIQCPCNQFPGRTYADCCGPYHNGTMEPMAPLDVLRSRYSAFCWRNIGYIIRSTHPTCRDFRENKVTWAKDLDRSGMFDSYDFVGLTVLGKEEVTNENEAFVEFEVKLRANRATEEIEGQIRTVKERSKFLRDPESKVWSYSTGDVSTLIDGEENFVLNA